MSTNNDKISVLFYLLEKGSEVHCELNIEGSKVYSIIINRKGEIVKNLINFKPSNHLPVTQKTKVLLHAYYVNKNLIVETLEIANKEGNQSQSFKILWWKLKDALL